MFAAGASKSRKNFLLGTPAYSACLLFSFMMAVLAQGWRVGAACGVGLALALLFYPAGLEPLRRAWLWVLIAFLVLPSAVFGDTGDWTLVGIALSQQGLGMGLQMALRTITIVVAVAGFAASVSVSEMAGLLERVGVKGFGFALGVAVNVLPIVQETATTTFHALRLRGGFRRQRLRAVRLFLVTIVVNSLRHADDIVSAAEARAFSTTRSRPMHMEWQRGDVILMGALGIIALAVLWA